MLLLPSFNYVDTYGVRCHKRLLTEMNSIQNPICMICTYSIVKSSVLIKVKMMQHVLIDTHNQKMTKIVLFLPTYPTSTIPNASKVLVDLLFFSFADGQEFDGQEALRNKLE